MIEQRRHARTPIQTPLMYSAKGEDDWKEGLARDISLGGMFIETSLPLGFNAPVVISVQLPGSEQVFNLPGVVRWFRHDGMGVQFGNLGARETFVIIEIGRNHDQQRRR